MGRITTDQSHAIVGILTANTNWDEIDFDQSQLQDQIIRNQVEAGKQFTAFLKNGGRVFVGESRTLKIDRSKPFNPAKFIGKGWSIWRGPVDGDGLRGKPEQDAQSLALTELDLSHVFLEVHLKEGETYTSGEERLRRLKAAQRIRLDAAVFQTLWENREVLQERFKQKTNGDTTFIFCDGTTLRSPFGYRYTLYLYFFGGKWRWSYRWLDYGRSARSPSAVLATISFPGTFLAIFRKCRVLFL